MAKAPLPVRPVLEPFFVLRWDVDAEEMLLTLAQDPRNSYSLGSDFPGIAELLARWGLTRFFADRCVDAGREFRAVQCLPSQDRVINLIPREGARDIIAKQFAELDSEDQGPSYAHL